VGRGTVKRRSGQTAMAGNDFRLAEEIEYIQDRAAERDGRLVTVGPLVLFSTETGDAWLLDPAEHLAARVARRRSGEHPLRRNRYQFRNPMEGKLPDRGRRLRLHRPRHCPSHHRPRLPNTPSLSVELSGKFQISLASTPFRQCITVRAIVVAPAGFGLNDVALAGAHNPPLTVVVPPQLQLRTARVTQIAPG